LVAFAAALGCRDAALRRDECGDWRITGDAGHVYAIPGGYRIIFLGSPRAWSFAKAAFDFATVTQDGDGEGVLRMERRPTPDEAIAIRDKLGIHKKRSVSEAELSRLRSLSFAKAA
jgi:hypothetical protein